jgi:2'-5' RNA ligase superfamily
VSRMFLLLMTPSADSLVEPWRAEHDWAARFGVTAHVTVRTPFLEPDEWPDVWTDQLTALLPVKLTLACLEDRPGALVILVQPDDQLQALTQAVGTIWTRLPPHKPNFEHPAYHMTVVRTQDSEIRRRASDAIAPHLPMEVTGTALWAAHGSPETGHVHTVVATAPRA